MGRHPLATITIRLDDDLKARVAMAVERAGRTADAFIVEAIGQAVGHAERCESFHRVADERWKHILATRQTVPWDDAKAWLEARSHGEQPPKPSARRPLY